MVITVRLIPSVRGNVNMQRKSIRKDSNMKSGVFDFHSEHPSVELQC